MAFDWDAQIKRQVEDFNRKLMTQNPALGYAEGGMPMPMGKPQRMGIAKPQGMIPGPVNFATGDDTMTPTKVGEYITPVEALVGKGRELAQNPGLSAPDALALGKLFYDQETMRLKELAGDNEPVRNVGMAPMGGYAEGGFIKRITDKIPPMPQFPNPLDPIKKALSPRGYAEGGYIDEGTTALESLNNSTIGPLPDYSQNVTPAVKPDVVSSSTPAPSVGMPTAAPAPVAPRGISPKPVQETPAPKSNMGLSGMRYVVGSGNNATVTDQQPEGISGIDASAAGNKFLGKYAVLNKDYGKEGYKAGSPTLDLEGPPTPKGLSKPVQNPVRLVNGESTLDYSPDGVKDPYYKPKPFILGKDQRMFSGDGTELIGAVEKQADMKDRIMKSMNLDVTPEGKKVPKGMVVDVALDEHGNPLKTIGIPYTPTAITSANIRVGAIPAYQSGPLPPGVTFNRKTNTYYSNGVPLTGDQVNSMGLDYAQAKSEASQRGGATSANINAANDLYQKNLPRLIELRKKVAAKGLLPDTQFSDINAMNQWLSEKSSDPDVVELKGKVKLQADNLQKTLGGAQGGEWAFKVADSLLNPSYQGAAFERRLRSHGEDLAELAQSRRSFGRNGVSGISPEQAAPKSSAPTIAPAGTRVPKKGGGFYTSDGKGGWK